MKNKHKLLEWVKKEVDQGLVQLNFFIVGNPSNQEIVEEIEQCNAACEDPSRHSPLPENI